jgi:CubicO group peptidase (beta-lactamase class C family)
VLDLFPRYAPVANLDDRKRAMTVRDVLTMRTGLDWQEDPYVGSPLEMLNNSSSDWLRLVLDWPMREQPGTRWIYNSGGVILLGGAIGLAARENAADYVRERLFRPIGIEGDKWARGYPDLLPHMGGGLFIRTSDLARLGYLVLRRGRWSGRQIVPEAWIEESTRRSVIAPRTFGPYRTDYGYLWWLLPVDRDAPTATESGVIVTASGAHGQWLFIVPRYDLVVVATADDDGASGLAPVDFLYRDILPSLR